MNPPTISLPYQLGEAYLPLLLHLLYEIEQPTMVSLIPSDDIGSAAQHMVTVLYASDERVEFLATVA